MSESKSVDFGEAVWPQTLVYEFLKKLGHQLPGNPSDELMTPAMRVTWAKIFLEEALELVNGLGCRVRMINGCTDVSPQSMVRKDLVVDADGLHLNMVDVMDGAADSHYVLLAISTLLGVHEEPFIQEVCKNNLLKFAPGHTFKDGKLIKPPGHPRPAIRELLDAQKLAETAP